MPSVKLAHLADLHLGFRQYHRQTPQGINQREADVAGAFRRGVNDVIAARPDVVLIAGDLFHSVRPTNAAILDSFHQLRRLREGLPGVPIVVIGGNHDTPRSVETGTILKLFEALGLTVVPQEARRVAFEALDLAVLGVPHSALVTGQRPSFQPELGARWNVLMLHGRIPGILPGDWYYEQTGALIEPAELHAERWSYVALGHYHVAHEVRPNMWYAGALEYVSPNLWGELKDEEAAGRRGQKGWLLVELGERPRVEFRPVQLARRVIDLEPIEGAGATPQQLNALICARVSGLPGGINDQIVRQLVWNVPRYVARDLDHARIRELKARALHYHLDIRRPPPRREVGVAAPGTRRTLAEVVAEYLARRPLDAGVPRERLIQLAREYLEQVEREAGPG